MRSLKIALPLIAAVFGRFFGRRRRQQVRSGQDPPSYVIAPVGLARCCRRADLLKHNGKSYQLDSGRVVGTPALGSGHWRTTRSRSATTPIRRSASRSRNAGMDDLRVISDQFQDGVPGKSNHAVLRAEGRTDPEGRGPQGQGGVQQRAGSAVDVAMRAMLKKHGPRG